MLEGNPRLRHADASCFNGEYIAGDVSPAYLDALALSRSDSAKSGQGRVAGQTTDLFHQLDHAE